VQHEVTERTSNHPATISFIYLGCKQTASTAKSAKSSKKYCYPIKMYFGCAPNKLYKQQTTKQNCVETRS